MLEHWDGPCQGCGREGLCALTLAYRGRPVLGLCRFCGRDAARVRAFVAAADAFRAGTAGPGERGALAIHRHEGLREGVSLVLFARLVPNEWRVPGQGRRINPPDRPPEARERLAAAERARVAPTLAPDSTEAPTATVPTPDAHRPAQGLWWRLRRVLGGEG